jgi:hypothetical protein
MPAAVNDLFVFRSSSQPSSTLVPRSEIASFSFPESEVTTALIPNPSRESSYIYAMHESMSA